MSNTSFARSSTRGRIACSHAEAGKLEDESTFHVLVRRKRLTAELLLDATCCDGAGDVHRNAGGDASPQLPDGQVIYTGGQCASWDRHPFLKAFGQPAREAVCECERESDLNLARALEMKNGDFLLGKVRAPDNRLGRLMVNRLPDVDIVDQLFLATLSRPPLADETRAALEHVANASDKCRAWRGHPMALLNTNEFLFRH
jgi:hypothetical protein